MKIENNFEKAEDPIGKKDLTRRGFLKVVGVFAISASVPGFISCDRETPEEACMGYILVDSRKCQGCLTCMITCSLVHEGCVNLSLARLQVLRNNLGCYPNNVRITQCRQCLEPQCVANCPTGAMFIDKENGNIRRVNKDECVGCGICVESCAYNPKKPIVTADDQYGGSYKSRKCDLCLNTPHHFNPKGGGVEGVRACEAVCPLNAIKFTTKLPNQEDIDGYETNLRNLTWGLLNYSTT